MVEVVEELGSDQFLYCSTEHRAGRAPTRAPTREAAPHTITVRAPGMSSFTRGEKVGLVPAAGRGAPVRRGHRRPPARLITPPRFWTVSYAEETRF